MTENKMGVMPVGKLIFTMSLPMILSMLIQALYNVVDSVFVSWINEESLTAVSMAFPIQNLMIAVAVGTGVGVNALLSRSLGEKNYDIANRAAENAVFLAVISCLVFTVLGTLTARVFFAVQSTDPQIVEYGTLYLRICSLGCVGIFIEITMERLLQATGRTFYTMITQGVGAVINIVLDPILIFGLGPFPQMGIAGAAIATVTGQIVAGILAFFFNAACNHDIHLSLRGFRPDGHIILRIYSVGIPSIVMNSIGSVMTFGLNQIVGAFTATATAVLGIYFKFQSFVFMPIFGLNNGMVPIVAYNYGARKKERMVQAIRLCIIAAVLIMLAGLLVIQFFSAQILMLFKASENMLAIGVPALKIICISFLFAGYCIIVGSVFQALGNGVYSLIVSIARQLVCILPLAYFFAREFGLHAVWYSIPIAEITSVVLSTILFRKIYLEKLKVLD